MEIEFSAPNIPRFDPDTSLGNGPKKWHFFDNFGHFCGNLVRNVKILKNWLGLVVRV